MAAKNKLSSRSAIDKHLKVIIGSSNLESKLYNGRRLLDLLQRPDGGRSLTDKGRAVLSSKEWSQVLLRILSERASLTLCHAVWGTDTFLEALEVNTTIECLYLYLPADGKGKIKELCQALTKNSSLKDMTLSSTTLMYLTERSELSTLTLCLGASKLNLNNLRFSGMYFEYTSTLQVSTKEESHTRRNVLKLGPSIILPFYDTINQRLFLNLLHGSHFHVLDLRLLNTRQLQIQDSPDVTSTIIVPYLKGVTGGSLERLRLQDVPVDIPALLEVLRTNKTLQSIHLVYTGNAAHNPMQENVQSATPSVLQLLQAESNLTLTDFRPFIVLCPKIHYLLDLNQFGRVAVRNGGVVDLIEGLDRAQEDGSVLNANHDGHDIIQSLIFGLLRERPELWSDGNSKALADSLSGPSQKRKRQEEGDGNELCGKKRG